MKFLIILFYFGTFAVCSGIVGAQGKESAIDGSNKVDSTPFESKKKEISINGSNTVNSELFKSHKEEIEKAANINLKVVVNDSGNGLRDLALGRCDIAMISAPLSEVAAILNEKLTGFINIDDYKEFKVGESPAVFIVNKNNPVDYISVKQLRGISEGDITNWKTVGGGNQRILFFTIIKGDGVRTTIQEQLLKGNFFGTYTTELRDSTIVKDIVAHLPEAIGTVSINNVNDLVKVVKTDAEFMQTLNLITKVDADNEIKRVIDVIKDIYNQSGKGLKK